MLFVFDGERLLRVFVPCEDIDEINTCDFLETADGLVYLFESLNVGTKDLKLKAGIALDKVDVPNEYGVAPADYLYGVVLLHPPTYIIFHETGVVINNTFIFDELDEEDPLLNKYARLVELADAKTSEKIRRTAIKETLARVAELAKKLDKIDFEKIREVQRPIIEKILNEYSHILDSLSSKQ